MIDALTLHQKRCLKTISESWFLIGQENSLNLWKEENIPRWRRHIEDSIDNCYIMEGMPLPKTKIWTPSPLVATNYIQCMEYPGLHHDLKKPQEIYMQLCDLLSEEVLDEIATATLPIMLQANAIEDAIIEEIYQRTGCQLNCNLGSTSAASYVLFDYIDYALSSPFLRELMLPCKSWVMLGKHGCGWWWMFDKIVLISEPFEVRENSFIYPDGFSVSISNQLMQVMKYLEREEMY